MTLNETGSKRAVRIDVISDVVCPWCFVGKKRLEEALEIASDLDAQVYWRPFQLDGTIPQGGIPRQDYLDKKFGPERAKTIYQRIEGIGAEAGIPFAFGKIKVSPNTLDAHRLIRWAQATGAQAAVKQRLFELFFLEGQDIGDHNVLAQVAEDNGIGREAALRLLASETDRDEVKGEVEMAARMGVTGVPFFIFNNRLALSGAQPAEVIVQAMRQSLEAGHDENPDEA
ncbi:MAG: DsbA family oxidoreductase [Alphaproteobacteria bacterium]|nr:DsbA family oxidoreductase [Alphaproteobacteria bacterium]